MNRNFIFRTADEALPALLGSVLTDGDEVGSRLGERTLELTHVGITLAEPWKRELLLPGRKANIAAQIVETMWVLWGRNDIDAILPYLPRAADFSDDGVEWRAGYGPRIRNHSDRREDNGYHIVGKPGVDQIDYIVELLRRSPGTRQAVATIWDPQVDTTPGKDIACNNWLSFISRLGYLDLHVAIRSNDAMWGWSGINAFEWSALQEIVAGMTGLMIGKLHFSVTSFHLYDRHWEKARLLAAESAGEFKDSPTFDGSVCPDMARFDELAVMWFTAEAQIRTGQPVDVDAFPEPMLRSWLRVLQWYWSGDVSYLQPLRNTRLYEACRVGTKAVGEPQPVEVLAEPSTHVVELDPPGGETEAQWEARQAAALDSDPEPPTFLEYVNDLHAGKHAAYGDSWKRRGEYMILANIARKIDRLEGGSETADETQTDTAIDLLVYLAKYQSWLTGGSGDPVEVEKLLTFIAESNQTYQGDEVRLLIERFEILEKADSEARKGQLMNMLPLAYTLARSRWSR